MTQVTDESRDVDAPQVDTLLDNALGPKAYYGVFTVLIHTDYGDHANANDIVAAAQERGVPVVSLRPDARLARRPQRLLVRGHLLQRRPAQLLGGHEPEGARPRGDASRAVRLRTAVRLTRDGQPVAAQQAHRQGRGLRRLQGRAGDYSATYANDTTAPAISGVNATADAEGHATVTWETDEPSSSRRRVRPHHRARQPGVRQRPGDRPQRRAHRPQPEHDLPLPRQLDRRRRQLGHLAGRREPPATFQTPPGALVDTRDLRVRRRHATRPPTPGQTPRRDRRRGPAAARGRRGVRGPALPAGWNSRSWGPGGEATTVERRAAWPTAPPPTRPALFDPPRVIEFTATFRPVNDQAVGFGDDLSDFPMAAFSTGNAGDALPGLRRRAAPAGRRAD